MIVQSNNTAAAASHRRATTRTFATGEAAAAPSKPERLAYDKLLLAVIDANPDLSSSTWQAVATAADLATTHKGSVTVLVVDEQVAPAGSSAGAGSADGASDKRLQQQAGKIAKALGELGVTYEVVERRVVGEGAKEAEAGSSAVVGDVADEVGADLLVVHSAAVHDKSLDANLLAEFCSCPVLLLP